MRSKQFQAGATLMVALVMLVVLTLLVVAAIRSSTTNVRIAGNMQVRNEAAAAAQQAIEQVISNNFTTNPVEQTMTIQTAGTDYSVKVSAPTCDSTKGITNDELVPTDPNDAACIGSGLPSNTGIIDGDDHSGSVTQWCSKQQWDVQATATENGSGVSVTHHQGVALRVPAGTSC
jgi:hypothetical protein